MKFFEKLAAGVLSFTIMFGAAQSEAATKSPKVEKRIAINSASRLMTYYENGVKKAVYPLGLGKTYTPTPVGYFKILEKAINPTWTDPSDPEYSISSGPDNPLGYRWMQIMGNYGIHGTNRPESIGGYVSNGCIRMREADVEKLYDAVDVGTPVDITYNRVVVEKIEDGNVVYYIYPDGYGWQSIDVDYVRGWLEPYGVAPFESDANIEDKIQLSDGKPSAVGKPYNIEVNGRRIKAVKVNGRDFLAKAVIRDNINYLPVVPLAMALRTKLEWREGETTLKTKYGTVTGFEKKNQIYCNADDAIILLNIDGGLQNISDKPEDGKVFKFYTANNPIDKPKPDKKSKDKKSDKDKTDKIKTDKIKTDKDKTTEIKIDKDKTTETKTDKNKPAEVKTDKDKPTEIKTDKDKADEIKIDKDKSDNLKTDDKKSADKKSKKDKKSKDKKSKKTKTVDDAKV